MSLNWFIGSKDENLKFIDDVDKFFESKQFRDDEFTHIVLREIEKAEYVNEITFKDRTGINLRINNLSTGVKALLCVHYFPDKLINFDEVGWNCYRMLLLLSEGNIFFTRFTVELPRLQENINFTLNNKHYSKIDAFNEEVDMLCCL